MAKQMAMQSIKSSNINIALATNSMHGFYMVGHPLGQCRGRRVSLVDAARVFNKNTSLHEMRRGNK
jgi:hypothetical protein